MTAKPTLPPLAVIDAIDKWVHQQTRFHLVDTDGYQEMLAKVAGAIPPQPPEKDSGTPVTAIEEEELRRALDASVEEIIDAIALSVKTGYVVHPTKKVISKLHGRHEIMKMFDAYVSALSQQHERERGYQTHVYYQRTLKNGSEVWGARIAYQGQQIYGDVAFSEEQAHEKIKAKLAELQQQSNGGKRSE